MLTTPPQKWHCRLWFRSRWAITIVVVVVVVIRWPWSRELALWGMMSWGLLPREQCFVQHNSTRCLYTNFNIYFHLKSAFYFGSLIYAFTYAWKRSLFTQYLLVLVNTLNVCRFGSVFCITNFMLYDLFHFFQHFWLNLEDIWWTRKFVCWLFAFLHIFFENWKSS